MKEFIKKHLSKIVIICLTLLYFNACTKSCSKTNTINKIQYELDSLQNLNSYINDSIVLLNNYIKLQNVEIENKNNQIEQLSTTLKSVLRKNTTNNIKVIVPEQKNENNNE